MIFSSIAHAQDASTAAEAHIERLREKLEESVEWYEFLPEADAESLQAHVVMRWDNRVRGAGSAVGLTVVWADNTRPHVIASIFPWSGLLMHECDLVSREPKLIARREGRVVWQPKTIGVEFQAVPDAPPPAASEPRRRLQLKQLATQFEATMLGWKADNSDREELRLLPQWLYRYGAEDAECFDGAVFAFVMGTDPEVFLLLEAVRPGGQAAQWQFGFVRGTSGALEGRHNGEVVWAAEKFPTDRNPALPHLTLREPLPVELRDPRPQ